MNGLRNLVKLATVSGLALLTSCASPKVELAQPPYIPKQEAREMWEKVMGAYGTDVNDKESGVKRGGKWAITAGEFTYIAVSQEDFQGQQSLMLHVLKTDEDGIAYRDVNADGTLDDICTLNLVRKEGKSSIYKTGEKLDSNKYQQSYTENLQAITTCMKADQERRNRQDNNKKFPKGINTASLH